MTPRRLLLPLSLALLLVLGLGAFAPDFPAAGTAFAQETTGDSGEADAEDTEAAEEENAEPELAELDGTLVSPLRLRSIGPALMSGRIGDIAVNPERTSEWYVAACSGGVWKTSNNGTTFSPIFDGQSSYSIGCLAIDPTNTNVVWVGTGENNSQRSVAFGDGLYKSVDGGKSWKHVGLRDSEHIGRIAIDPRDGDVVYVAAQGPLWRSGGDRGLYKTTDGGKSWSKILDISENTGINEVHFDPRDPDTLYASSYQRRRHVWTLINGGPESTIYKSTDAGATWRKIERGLPGSDKGRIGLAVSPVDPDVIYAIVEAASGGGFFRSTDRGETWRRMSSTMSSSPQYYNELVCDPSDVHRVYLLDTYLQVTDDGGSTFSRAGTYLRHVDDHALWIDPDDPTHVIVGSDGGIYESFDRCANWQFKANLPLTQFYKVCTDNSEPFYYIYGGTQDNNTQGGPSRTTDRAGITNADWFVTVGGDGFESQVDPEDPNIVYSQWQYGGLVRHDRRSGETVDIKPREVPGEEAYTWNWDSPLLISPHSHTRIYYAADKLFRSEDRGNSWTRISDDLTRGIDRNQLPVMGVIQSPDAVSKNRSTSVYGNATALAESPLEEGLLYVGTDDGLVHVSEDNGENWRKVDVFPGVPHMTYVDYLYASNHEADRVFACFSNHKNGDFTPYVLRSDDRGRTWTSIAGDLPERDIVWAIAEDHVMPELLFVGTEFGAYATNDGGEHWQKLRGMPTIAVRDVEIQKRENDLVLGTFGRGFYVLDDYSPLRHLTTDVLKEDAAILPVKDALLYVERSRLGGRNGVGYQGSAYYQADNPPFGAIFTYWIKDSLESKRDKRKKAGKNAPYPTVEEFRAEDEELAPRMLMTIRDSDGNVVRHLTASKSKGLHRMAWDLRYPGYRPVRPGGGSSGPLVVPGTFTATLSKEVAGEITELTEPVSFVVKPLEQGTFAADDRAEVLAFQKQVGELQRAVTGAQRVSGDARSRVAYLRTAILETPEADTSLLANLAEIEGTLNTIDRKLTRDRTRARLYEPVPPSISGRISNIVGDQYWVTSPPTQTQRDQYQYASDEFEEVLAMLTTLVEEDLAAVESALDAVGAPWTPGRMPGWPRD